MSDKNAASGASYPLYQRVSDTLRAEVLEGLYPVGSRLPTESELCTRFSLSRHTIREALRLLRDEGLVSSRRGAGTIVVPPHAAGSDVHHVMSIGDLVAFATETTLAIDSVNMTKLSSKIAQRTDLAGDREWLVVSGLRQGKEDKKALCMTEYYINRAYAAVGRLLQRHTGPVFPLIEDMFGVTIGEVRQQISATLISPGLATGLDVEPGSAALEVRRSYFTPSDEIAQVTINTHPASRFTHSMTMRRIKSYGATD